MGVLLTIAGIVILLYTLSNIMGLWLSRHVIEIIDQDEPLPEALADTPEHHLDLMANYAFGMRGQIWSVSIACLIFCLIAMAFNSPLAFWALGMAMAIDSLLFMSCPNIKDVITQSSPLERLFDAAQNLALLACFALLYWVSLRGAG